MFYLLMFLFLIQRYNKFLYLASFQQTFFKIIIIILELLIAISILGCESSTALHTTDLL